MRSRSSRFFVVLLHWVGCPQPFQLQGVQPWPMVLETLSGSENPEPVWLQDAATQTCLGPNARLTEHCGDATLWLPVRQPLRKRKRARMGLWGVDEEEWDTDEALVSHTHAWVFYYLDQHTAQEVLQHTTQPQRSWWWNPFSSRRRRNNTPSPQSMPLECLTYNADNRTLAVQVCDSVAHKISQTAALPSWGWRWSNDGDELDQSLRPAKRSQPDLCAVAQEGDRNVHLEPCQGMDDDKERIEDDKKRDPTAPQQLELSMVRYRAAPAALGSPHRQPTRAKKAKIKAPSPTLTEEEDSTKSKPHTVERSSTLPSIRDLAHRAAMDPSTHPRHLLFNERRKSGALGSIATATADAKTEKKKRLEALHKSNPILLVGDSLGQAGGLSKTAPRSSSSSLAHPDVGASSSSPGGVGSSTSMDTSTLHHRPRRIPVHPYIAASQNEVWTDPQTGLLYPTDLSGYLGYDRKERGRQTLMGVGQYRKGYVIKVYGIAYYVSKRDVLADPFFEAYADLSTQELQQRPEFFDHLRLHPHNFERSIFIKTNMQLSAETIRGSLKADWSMLTDEAKDTIMESSLRPQPVDERTLEIIKDTKNNPSKCSCVSIAPEELGADPSCCARGTELVFTWLKNGDVVCRLNGRVVDVFPRPDIAEGIFFEYLRNDDPISPELHDNAVTGFPFMLAPLTQVQGVHTVPGHSSKPSTQKDDAENPLAKAWSEFAEGASAHASNVAGSFQKGMADTAAHFQQAVRSAGDSARAMGDSVRSMGDSVRSMSDDFGKDLTRRRELLAKRAAAFPDVVARMRKDPIQTFKEITSRVPPMPAMEASSLTPEQLERQRRLAKLSAEGYPLSRWFGDSYQQAPDEIGPMRIQPTMKLPQKFFLFLVHLYLLLLFIVSFPGSYATKTRFIRVASRRPSTESVTSSAYWDEEEEEYEDEEVETSNPIQAKDYFSPRYVRGVKLALAGNNHNNLSRSSSLSVTSGTTLSAEDEEGSDDNSSLSAPPLKQKSLSYHL